MNEQIKKNQIRKKYVKARKETGQPSGKFIMLPL